MTKVKIMRFCVSNWTSSPFGDDIGKENYEKKKEEIVSTQKIEKTINAFCKKYKVINIQANTIDVHYHNNGRGNTIDMVYTITYEES